MADEILIVKNKQVAIKVKSAHLFGYQNFYDIQKYQPAQLKIGTILLFVSNKELTKHDTKKVHGKRAAAKISKLKAACWLAVACNEDYWSRYYKPTHKALLDEINAEWQSKKSISGCVYLDPKTFKKYWISHYDLEYYQTL